MAYKKLKVFILHVKGGNLRAVGAITSQMRLSMSYMTTQKLLQNYCPNTSEGDI